ncbi:hypothetical protein Holit_02574 [Hollandina sp. SP2]
MGETDLKEIMCFEYERTVSNDCVIRHECRLFQILKTGKPMPRPKDKVTVRVRLDGSHATLFKGKPLLVKELMKTEKGLKTLSMA